DAVWADDELTVGTDVERRCFREVDAIVHRILGRDLGDVEDLARQLDPGDELAGGGIGVEAVGDGVRITRYGYGGLVAGAGGAPDAVLDDRPFAREMRPLAAGLRTFG